MRHWQSVPHQFPISWDNLKIIFNFVMYDEHWIELNKLQMTKIRVDKMKKCSDTIQFFENY